MDKRLAANIDRYLMFKSLLNNLDSSGIALWDRRFI